MALELEDSDDGFDGAWGSLAWSEDEEVRGARHERNPTSVLTSLAHAGCSGCKSKRSPLGLPSRSPLQNSCFPLPSGPLRGWRVQQGYAGCRLFNCSLEAPILGKVGYAMWIGGS